MKTSFILTTALVAFGGAVAAQTNEINLTGWGGAGAAAINEAFNKPFTAATGIRVNVTDADDPATPLKAQIEAGNVIGDVFDLELASAIQLCDEGGLMLIDPATLPPAPDGTPAADDFLPGALSDCGVGNLTFGTVIAYDRTRFPDNPPQTVADFFDLEAFPGKRGLPKTAKRTLYLALLADGVAPDAIYDTLSTPEGVTRAFAKLDTIKPQVVWWEAGAQPPQLLADGEVVMTTSYNGRIFDAQVAEGKPFEVIWDGQYVDYDLFVIPKDAPHADAAMEYVKYATDTQQLANLTQYIAYGPPRKSSAALVGLYKDGKTEMAPYMPTNPENLKTAVYDDPEFWADHDAELTERFNAWLMQ
ncbi:MAG: ABC transporter substrate-binding protein [Paracoccus sp. (in: a-proteobacteria)]|uniref:ABC transporter substrate-binding protein n=1 Tax=Paracoccus sp. TaxID=267 RepID=UPI0026DEF6B0|nr:ABC transporter substrate-binding protein [Paracoccus sp. (in: a-proteobacteria)]MDO5621878.1 ABC transporter substrate-binding protein [Paracoccus sp. (in: a-proteobacteria)]